MTKQLMQVMVALFIMLVASAKFIVDAGAGQISPAPVSLVSFAPTASGYQFEVMSTGCTTDSDFTLEYANDSEFAKTDALSKLLLNDKPVFMQIIRVKEDRCRRKPMKKTIVLPAPEALHGVQLYISNPFRAATRIKREAQ